MACKYSTWNRGQDEALLNMLGGQEVAEQILQGLVKVELVMVALIKALLTITLGAVGVKHTKDCFTNKARYYHRDQELDNWLPKKWEARSEGKMTVWQFLKELTFIEMAQNLLKTKESDVKKLSKLLKDGNHTFTLPEIEALIERQEGGEDVGFLTNSYANFFFVEDNDGNVSVVDARRRARRWRVYVSRLDDGARWRVGRRLFSRKTL